MCPEGGRRCGSAGGWWLLPVRELDRRQTMRRRSRTRRSQHVPATPSPGQKLVVYGGFGSAAGYAVGGLGTGLGMSRGISLLLAVLASFVGGCVWMVGSAAADG